MNFGSHVPQKMMLVLETLSTELAGKSRSFSTHSSFMKFQSFFSRVGLAALAVMELFFGPIVASEKLHAVEVS